MAAGFLMKGIFIGLLFGIPVEAVGTLTVQRAYRHGFAAGLKTGLGSSVAGVFIGTFLWWWMLSAGVVFLRKKAMHGSFRYMNQMFGTVLTLFGTIIFIRVIF